MDVGAGVIDADYRGNVGVVLFNHADEDYKGVPVNTLLLSSDFFLVPMLLVEPFLASFMLPALLMTWCFGHRQLNAETE
jgi:hypothetical protein